MEAGDGALTRGLELTCPVRGCPPLASLDAMRVTGDQHGSELGRNRSVLPQLINTGGPARHMEIPWHEVDAPNPSAPASFRPNWPSREGSSPEWGETARQAPVGTTRARSRLCRDVP